MVEIGDPAPDFEAPYASRVDADEMTWGETYRLSDQLGDGPVVLAFFPGAFSPTCVGEMNSLNERLESFEEHAATVVGISADLPFALHEFHDELGLGFDVLSDYNRSAAKAYDAAIDSEFTGLEDINSRALFVIDSEETVAYKWDGDPINEPPYDEVEDAVKDAA